MNAAIGFCMVAAVVIGGYGYVVYVGLKYQKESEEIRAEKRARKKAKKEEKRLKSIASG